MQKEEEKNTIKEFVVQNIPWFAGILVAILNLWFLVRIAPLTESVIKINGRVSAIENTLDKHEIAQKEIFDQIVIRIDHISERVDLLVGKLIK